MIFFPSVHSISKISLRISAGLIFYKVYFVLILWVWKTRTKERCKMQLVRNDDQTFCYLKYTSTLAAHRIIRATTKNSLKILFWAFLQVKKEKTKSTTLRSKVIRILVSSFSKNACCARTMTTTERTMSKLYSWTQCIDIKVKTREWLLLSSGLFSCRQRLQCVCVCVFLPLFLASQDLFDVAKNSNLNNS